MKIIVIDADRLTKIVLEKVFSEIKQVTYVFIDSTVENLEKTCRIEDPRLVLFSLRKGHQMSVVVLNRLLKESSNSRLVVIADPSYQHVLRDISKTEELECLSKPFSKKEIVALVHRYRISDPAGNPFVDQLRQLVLKKDFMNVYNQIQALQEMISQSNLADHRHTMTQLEEMIDAGLSLMNCTNQAQQLRYKEKMNFTSQTIQDKFRIQFKLYDFFHEIYRQRSIQKRPQLSQLFDYVEKNVYEEMTLAEAAKSCQISQSYLSRILKENYAVGFNSYVQIEKVFLAKKNFYYNNDKIIDVSFQLSYSEPSYFCKVFKRIEGKTPTDVKDEMEETRKLAMS